MLVGINLLREGLDIPEVTLVTILDADKEGFLRSETALIQTCGRAARNAKGRVIMYADKMTKSIEATIRTTKERRAIQEAYNAKHNIVPKTVIKGGATDLVETFTGYKLEEAKSPHEKVVDSEDLARKLADCEKLMLKAAKEQQYEGGSALSRPCQILQRALPSRRQAPLISLPTVFLVIGKS